MNDSPRIRRRRALLGVVWLGVLGLVMGRELWESEELPRRQTAGGWEFVFVEGQAVGVGSRGDAASPVDTVRIESGWILLHEFRVGDFCQWLNEVSPPPEWTHPQVEFVGRGWRPREGLADHPLAYVDAREAERLCEWAGNLAGIGAAGRLPREAEWVIAARAGAPGLTYAWGFEEPSWERACFGALASRRTGSYEANRWGLVDVCGNVAEWCGDNTEPSQWTIKGGSFAERDPHYLRVAKRVSVAPSYKDADVGFRVWIPAISEAGN